MNHYPHHIGDFDRATRHLTRMERSIYRDLLDLYYDTEAPLTLDREKLCRRIIARSNEESTAVEQVLNEFFTETPAGWYHDRCEAEIEAYRNNTSQKAQAGKASAEAKRLRKQQAINAASTGVEQPLNERSGSVGTDDNGASTNQNQNQNQEPIQTHAPLDGEESARVVSMSGAVCMAMRVAGLASVNSSSPELLQLIESGADIGCFVDAARLAVKKGKGFAYALGIVSGQLQDAAAMAKTAMAARPKTPKPDEFSSIDYGQGGKL